MTDGSTAGPVPHPAAVPAVAAIERLLADATDERDRAMLRAAVDSIQAAYPALGRQWPRRTIERDEYGWPILRPFRGTAWEAHDDPEIELGPP